MQNTSQWIPRSWTNRGWTLGQLASALILLAASLWIAWPVWRASVVAGLGPAFLVAILGATRLIWVRRQRLGQLPLRHTWSGVAIVLAGLLTFGAGLEQDSNVLAAIGAASMTAGAAISGFGLVAPRGFVPIQVLAGTIALGLVLSALDTSTDRGVIYQLHGALHGAVAGLIVATIWCGAVPDSRRWMMAPALVGAGALIQACMWALGFSGPGADVWHRSGSTVLVLLAVAIPCVIPVRH